MSTRAKNYIEELLEQLLPFKYLGIPIIIEEVTVSDNETLIYEGFIKNNDKNIAIDENNQIFIIKRTQIVTSGNSEKTIISIANADYSYSLNFTDRSYYSYNII